MRPSIDLEVLGSIPSTGINFVVVGSIPCTGINFVIVIDCAIINDNYYHQKSTTIIIKINDNYYQDLR